jgi:hypothetical protein
MGADDPELTEENSYIITFGRKEGREKIAGVCLIVECPAIEAGIKVVDFLIANALQNLVIDRVGIIFLFKPLFQFLVKDPHRNKQISNSRLSQRINFHNGLNLFIGAVDKCIFSRKS